MEGGLRSLLRREGENVWSLQLEMRGELATPWPDRRSLSGQEWVNPEGDFIQVPYIESHFNLTGNGKKTRIIFNIIF